MRYLCTAALVVMGTAVGSGPARAGSKCHSGICVHWKTLSDGGLRVDAHNGQYGPATITIELDRRVNVAPSAPVPLMLVIPARTKRHVLTLSQAQPNQEWWYSWHHWVVPGDPAAVHDDTTRYRLPYDTATPRRLNQGVGGAFSHTGRGHYSFDILMPVGTPIHAARSGRVMWTVDKFTKGGREKRFQTRANLVRVLHDDGTYAEYLHLQRQGVIAKKGQRVKAGDVIALSGNTGRSTEPHLHFSVWRAGENGRGTTVPIRFDNGTAAGFVPEAGRDY